MSLKNLHIENFRNFAGDFAKFCNNFNVLYGENGAGKTNFLEAIYYLGTGRSFRCHLLPRLVKHGADQFLLRCELAEEHGVVSVGVKRSLDRGQDVRINGEKANSIVELARFLPVQFLNQDGYQILNGGPKFRRQMLDWGVFHVEHAPLSLWKRINQALRQRNAALKLRDLPEQIKSWDKELALASTELHRHRQAYFAKLAPIAKDFLRHLLSEINAEMSYHCGWEIAKDLNAIFAATFTRDLQLGFTQYGPHRADIRWSINGIPPQDLLSRGQQKLFILALYLAQGELLTRATGKPCVFLIDDLMAELDRQKQTMAVEALVQIEAQIFVTSIDKNELAQSLQAHPIKNAKTFHVEHGKICEE